MNLISYILLGLMGITLFWILYAGIKESKRMNQK